MPSNTSITAGMEIGVNDINTEEARIRALSHTFGRAKITRGRADGDELIKAAQAIGKLPAITVEQAVVWLNTSYQTLRAEIGKSPPRRAVTTPTKPLEHVPRPRRGRDKRKYYDPVKLKAWWEGRTAAKRRPSQMPAWRSIENTPLPSWRTGWVTYGPQSAIVTHISISGMEVSDFVALFKAGAVVEFMTVTEAMHRPWAVHAEWQRWFEPWKAALMATIAEGEQQGLKAALSPAPLPDPIRL